MWPQCVLLQISNLIYSLVLKFALTMVSAVSGRLVAVTTNKDRDHVKKQKQTINTRVVKETLLHVACEQRALHCDRWQLIIFHKEKQ